MKHSTQGIRARRRLATKLAGVIGPCQYAWQAELRRRVAELPDATLNEQIRGLPNGEVLHRLLRAASKGGSR